MRAEAGLTYVSRRCSAGRGAGKHAGPAWFLTRQLVPDKQPACLVSSVQTNLVPLCSRMGNFDEAFQFVANLRSTAAGVQRRLLRLVMSCCGGGQRQ